MPSSFVTFTRSFDDPFTSSGNLVTSVVGAVRERAAHQGSEDSPWAIEVKALWKYGQARAVVNVRFRPDVSLVEVKVKDHAGWDSPSVGTRNTLYRELTGQLERLLAEVNGGVPSDVSELIEQAVEVTARLEAVKAEATVVLAQLKLALR